MRYQALDGPHQVGVLVGRRPSRSATGPQATDLARLVRRVEGPRAPAAAAQAEALRRGDVAGLLAVATTWQTAGLTLAAAEAAAQAATLVAPTDPLAPTAARRAAELAAACPGAPTPALVAAARPLPITERQREVATLCARLSNAQVAERLGVSIRTVEGHIYHACIALGLPGRAALVALVAGDPSPP
jgi:DNA-binding CsgD family transcriptional regulator